jgi:hypothetical protein
VLFNLYARAGNGVMFHSEGRGDFADSHKAFFLHNLQVAYSVGT